ncbi:hypothetical protein DER45DRAFT_544845 [Fusarium avenaceum]|nr:hypothetical protein DER45DRAFT_544845 [Fusarium avenaceum]
MCRHTSKQTYCGHTRKHYLDRLHSKMRFRIYLCPATQRDVKNAFLKHGALPDVNTLAETCGLVFGRDYVGKVLRDKFERQCNMIVKVMRTQEKDIKVEQRPVSFSDPLPGPSTPMHDLELGRNVSKESVGVSVDDDASMDDAAMDDECLRMLTEKLGTTLLV